MKVAALVIPLYLEDSAIGSFHVILKSVNLNSDKTLCNAFENLESIIKKVGFRFYLEAKGNKKGIGGNN